MPHLFTSGQVARKLRISISTLKRWLDDPKLVIPDQRNYNGWRLFSDADIEKLHDHKRKIRRSGKQFNETMLIPVAVADKPADTTAGAPS